MVKMSLEGSAKQALRLGGINIGVAFVLSFFVNVLRLGGPLFMVLIYDRVLPSRSQETLIALLIMVIIFMIALGLLDYARKRIVARFAAQFQERLEALILSSTPQNEMFANGKSKPGAGLDEVDGLRSFFHSGSLIAIFDFFWTPMFAAVIFIMHPYLGWVAIAGATIIAILVFLQLTFEGDRKERQSQAAKQTTELKNMVIASQRVLRSQEVTGSFKKRWHRSRNEGRDNAIAARDWSMWFDSMSSTMVMMIRYCVLAMGAYLTLRGEVTVGAMVAATFMVTRVLSPVDRFMRRWPDTTAALENWKKLKIRLKARDAEQDDPYAERGGSTKLRVAIDNLSVRSMVNNALILKAINLKVEPGKMIEILGQSSTGKTVLAEAMVGIWKRNTGTLLFNGKNIARMSDNETSKLFGFVPEVPRFFAGTIEENIAHFDVDIDESKVALAAKQAHLYATISALPDGFKTIIDADGSSLSKSQRTQLALARALYYEPEVIVIDDLDPVLLTKFPKTMTKTLDTVINRGGTVILLGRKSLGLSSISETYQLADGKLKQTSAPKSVVANTEKKVIGKISAITDKRSVAS